MRIHPGFNKWRKTLGFWGTGRERKLRNRLIEGLGLWVSKYGRVLEVRTHIQSVVECPSAFGCDPDELGELFAAHGELLGYEGTARVVVLERLIDAGWVRFRHYRISGWSVNVASLSGTNRALITAVFQHLYDGQSAFDAVKLNGRWGTLRRDVGWLLDGGWLAGADDVPDALPTLTLLDHPDQIPPSEIVPVSLSD